MTLLRTDEVRVKESVTLELDGETLARAREAGIDLSALLELTLRRALRPQPSEAERKRIAQQWYEDNKEAVDGYNEYVEKYGLFSDGHRTF
jgi:antitoxin CcdA